MLVKNKNKIKDTPVLKLPKGVPKNVYHKRCTIKGVPKKASQKKCPKKRCPKRGVPDLYHPT